MGCEALVWLMVGKVMETDKEWHNQEGRWKWEDVVMAFRLLWKMKTAEFGGL